MLNSKNSLSSLLSNHLFTYPTPTNLGYSWSFGSLAGLIFAIQLITGIFLAMHYTPHTEWAFSSVEHIMSDVNGGYLFRYFHANGASAVFILIYAHMFRNLYYQTYLTRPALWQSGVVIFLLMMATAFIGYVLPWGQMSFWGATVITSLVTAVPFVGEDVAYWIWGGFSINNATLTRFFSLHYLLPFLVTGVILLHLALLHSDGSTDPLTLSSTPSKVPFHPYYTYKDAFVFTVTLAAFGALVAYLPNLLGHSDNFLPANPLVTPAHIVPEWYFTPFYAILRACPNKLGGAIGMFSAIVLLLALPYLVDSPNRYRIIFAPHSTIHRVSVWFFAGVFLTLMFLGSRAAAAPYVTVSKIFTILYFSYFLLFLPIVQRIHDFIIVSPNVEENEDAVPLPKKRRIWVENLRWDVRVLWDSCPWLGGRKAFIKIPKCGGWWDTELYILNKSSVYERWKESRIPVVRNPKYSEEADYEALGDQLHIATLMLVIEALWSDLDFITFILAAFLLYGAIAAAWFSYWRELAFQVELLRDAAHVLVQVGYWSPETRDEQLALLEPPYRPWYGPRVKLLPVQPDDGALTFEEALAVDPSDDVSMYRPMFTRGRLCSLCARNTMSYDRKRTKIR